MQLTTLPITKIIQQLNKSNIHAYLIQNAQTSWLINIHIHAAIITNIWVMANGHRSLNNLMQIYNRDKFIEFLATQDNRPKALNMLVVHACRIVKRE